MDNGRGPIYFGCFSVESTGDLLIPQFGLENFGSPCFHTKSSGFIYLLISLFVIGFLLFLMLLMGFGFQAFLIGVYSLPRVFYLGQTALFQIADWKSFGFRSHVTLDPFVLERSVWVAILSCLMSKKPVANVCRYEPILVRYLPRQIQISVDVVFEALLSSGVVCFNLEPP